jgi:GT2 family glycosyltransferase
MVSIIILSYNTEELLKRCLTSIFAHVKNIPFEIIVVDNDSSDESVRMVKREFTKVHLIENKKNVGFAAGCNIGAKAAKGEYLLFLNSDSELHENAPEKLSRIFHTHEDAALVGGMLENIDGTLQRSFGSFYTLFYVFRMLYGGDKAEMKRFTDNAVKKVDWVTGGCLMVKKEAFDLLQGFDEHFFMYVEDMELCYRARQNGLGVYIDPSTSVKHVGQGSSDKTFAVVNIYKGLVYFYKKHKNKVQYYVVRVLLGSKAVLSVFLGFMTGNSYLKRTYIKALRTL